MIAIATLLLVIFLIWRVLVWSFKSSFNQLLKVRLIPKLFTWFLDWFEANVVVHRTLERAVVDLSGTEYGQVFLLQRELEQQWSDVNIKGVPMLYNKLTKEFVVKPVVQQPVKGDVGVEMAVPTSEEWLVNPEQPDRTSVPGVLSIRDYKGHVRGMAACIKYNGNVYLQTAAHVWDLVVNKLDLDVILEHNGASYKLKEVNYAVHTFSPTAELDFIWISLPQVLWSRLEVKALRLKPLFSSKKVTTYGYTAEGFVTTMGRATAHPSEWGRLAHYATTYEGFSGAPLLVGGNVVGVHTGFNKVEGFNLATVPALMLVSGSETESELLGDMSWVDELPKGKWKKARFSTHTHEFEVTYVGRFARLDKYEGNEHFTFQDSLDEYADYDLRRHVVDRGDYDNDHSYYNSKSERRRRYNNRGEAAVDEDDAPSRAETPVEVIKKDAKQDFQNRDQQTLCPKISKNSEKSGGKGGKPIPKVLVSSKSEPAISKTSPKRPKGADLSKPHRKSDVVLQSGTIPVGQQQLSDEVSSSKPRDITVSRVLLTRKQEKLYNSICHTRKFQQVLRTLTSDQALALRRRALEYATTYGTVSGGNPVQDFLLML
jgi:hypothetical protein